MFETPRASNDGSDRAAMTPADASGDARRFDRSVSSSSSGSGHVGGARPYVEGEEAVIALMKNQSTVKARMAQFSGSSAPTPPAAAPVAAARRDLDRVVSTILHALGPIQKYM